MSAVAGVDGGGSGTRAVVLDEEGRELGAAEGPPGLVEGGGARAAADAVEETVRAAAAAAAADVPLAALWCGLAGAGRPDRRRRVEEILEGRGLARRVGVGTDVEAAFRDALGPGAAGVLLVAGTGSICLGRSREGGSIRVGGWGRLLGDEGSGYRIGLEGLRAVLRAHDGRGAATTLVDRLTEALGTGRPAELVAFAEGASKAELGGLAPEVIRAAGDGDGPAERILDAAVGDLAAHVEAAFRRMEGGEGAAVVLAGGLLAPGRILGDRVEAALREDGRRVERRSVRAERGAAWMALEAVRSGEP